MARPFNAVEGDIKNVRLHFASEAAIVGAHEGIRKRMTDHSANGPIEGVFVRELKPNRDHRGELVEVYQEQWGDGWRATQFNAVFSEPNVLRGVHVHASHYDYRAD